MAKRKNKPTDPQDMAGIADEDPIILVCQGRPACDFEGEDGAEAHMAACVWCTRITCHADGSETVTQPVRC